MIYDRIYDRKLLASFVVENQKLRQLLGMDD